MRSVAFIQTINGNLTNDQDILISKLRAIMIFQTSFMDPNCRYDDSSLLAQEEIRPMKSPYSLSVFLLAYPK